MKATKVKCLGDYLNPEQFLALDGNVCPFDDSLKVYNYLIKTLGLPKETKVLPVEIVLKNNEKLIDLYGESDIGNSSYIFWAAMNLKEGKIYTFIPAFYFEDFESFVNEHSFVNINLLERDMYFVWKNDFCAVIYTSSGEAVIRKVNGVWSEYDVNSLVTIREPNLIHPDIYPVELFSISQHKFVCAAWAIDDAENGNVLWYTIQWDDEDILSNYDAADLTELPLNVGDVTRAGGVSLEVCYMKDYGFYLTKTSKPLPEHITSNKYAMEAKLVDNNKKILSRASNLNIELKPEYKENFKLNNNGKCKILEMFPSKSSN